MSRFEKSFIYAMIFSAVCISIYGYIDDKYEARARYKILLQFFSLSFLIFYAGDLLASKNHTNIAITIATILGFLLVNGSNLLDGLDTLSIKIGSITSLAFIALGVYSDSALCIQLSVATITALGVFYFYNKPPAKMYMGEIGSCLLGLIYTAQSILCYSTLKTRMLGLDALSLILMVASLPICELGISFLRRIYFGKSPFNGDKLHFHYIIKLKEDFSIQNITNIFALGNLIIITLGYIVMLTVSPFAGLLTVNSLYCGIYISYCQKEWIKNQNELSAISLFTHLPKYLVKLVNSSDLEKIVVKINIEDEASEDQSKRVA